MIVGTRLLLFFALGFNARAGDVSSHFVKFCQFLPGVYVGSSIRDESAARALADADFKAVVSVQGGDYSGASDIMKPVIKWWEPGETPIAIAEKKQAIEALGMLFFSKPLDSRNRATPGQKQMVQDAVNLIADPKMRPVYLTCAHGIDRSRMILAFYRVLNDHWTPQEAYDEWVANGHNWFRQIFTGNLDRFFWLETTGSFRESRTTALYNWFKKVLYRRWTDLKSTAPELLEIEENQIASNETCEETLAAGVPHG